MRHNGRYRDDASPGLLERLVLPVIQSVTDGVLPHPRSREGPERDSISLGTTQDPFNRKLSEEQRLPVAALHTSGYLAGSSGSGKTRFILMLVMALIQRCIGFTLLDIQGDLTRMILAHLVSLARDARWARLIRERLAFIDFFHPNNALTYNVLATASPQQRYLLIADLLARLRSQWRESWGPRMDEILRNALLVLALQRRPFADAVRFLTDETYRSVVVAACHDPILRAFWQTRFEPLSDGAKLAAVQPVLNKIAPLIDDFYLRHVFAQAESRLDLRQTIDGGKWTIVNLSKGVAGANTRQVGAMVVSGLWTAANSRIDTPEEERPLSVLVADEFQNFLGAEAPFDEILVETRKLRVPLVIAHQNLSQLDRQVRDAIFGNVGSMYFFRLGLRDAPFVADAFADQYRPLVRQELLNLKVGQAITRTPDGGFRVLSVHHVTKPDASDDAIAQLLQPSFDRYYRPRAEVDRELLRRYAPEVTDITRGRLRPAARKERQAIPHANTPLPEGEL